MVKTVALSADVPAHSADALFGIVYGDGDPALLRSFHREMNDSDVEVGAWVDDTRTLRFATPVDAPAFIKRMVGKDVMQVEEAQRRAALPGGGWQLTSVPAPDMPGGNKFVTQAVFTFRDGPGAGCQVDVSVTCTASGPYGLTGTIESFMAEAAKKGVEDFLGFMKQYVQAAVAPTAAAAAATAAAPPPAAQAAAAAPEEHFYDALDLPLPPPPPLPLPHVAAGPAAVPSGDGLRFEDAALLYLRYMCRTGDQTVGLLQALELHVRSLDAKVARLEAAAREQQQQRRWLPRIPDTISTRQALLGAALLASGTATAAFMYGRRQQAALRMT